MKLAPVFSEYGTLQRNKNINVFGEGKSGEYINATLETKEKTEKVFTQVAKDGRFLLTFPPFQEAEKATLTVKGEKESVCYSHMQIGEVWFAGGQSNMEYELQNCLGGKEILNENPDKYTGIRFYYTPKINVRDESYEDKLRNSSWEIFGKEQAARWSAVGFFFAVRLQKELNIPIGIIGCNWGGTSASAWMSRDALLENEKTSIYIEEFDQVAGNKSFSDQVEEYKEYELYHADWEKRTAPVFEKDPQIDFDLVQKLYGVCKYPGPMNMANPMRPTGLYDTMITNLLPYTLAGFIYYQGESDDHRPDSYYVLLNRLIRQWREDFRDNSLPFLLVQLPMHRFENEPDKKNWCVIREAQMKTYETTKNVGIAVCIDCGEFHQIHPKDKKEVGKRLALQALYQVYGCLEENQVFGPVYKDAVKENHGVFLRFKHTEGGIEYKEAMDKTGPQNDKDAESHGFEIAGIRLDNNQGEEETFVPAQIKELEDGLFIYAEEIKEATEVRYLWTNYGEVTIYGRNNLPMAPFRTGKIGAI